MKKITFMVMLIGAACLVLLPPVSNAEVNRIELHPIQTKTLNDVQFLSGADGGKQATIAGELRLPASKDKLPAVVLLHGSSGYLGYIEQWVEFLYGMGIATFVPDSLSGRGLRRVGAKQADLGRLATVFDAYRALDVLAGDDRIDKKRIVLMGFSRGGQAALYAALRRFHDMYETKSNEFAAYISFYPNCVTTYIDDDKVAQKPIRIFHGAADDYNPVVPCQAYVKRLKATGADVELTVYPGAYHAFDYDKFKKPIKLAKAQSARNCKLKEVSPGRIINTESGKDFTYDDPCVERGVTVGYNADATIAAREAVRKLMIHWLLK
jgi:dienelactone hydrolase